MSGSQPQQPPSGGNQSPPQRPNWATAKVNENFKSNSFNSNFNAIKNFNGENEEKTKKFSKFLENVGFYIGRCILYRNNMNNKNKALEEFRVNILQLASIIDTDFKKRNPKNTNWFFPEEIPNKTFRSYVVKILEGKFGVKENKQGTISYTPLRKVTINRVIQLMSNAQSLKEFNFKFTESNRRSAGGKVMETLGNNAPSAKLINKKNINKLNSNGKDYSRMEVIKKMIERLLKNKNIRPIISVNNYNSMLKKNGYGMSNFKKKVTSESDIYNAINQKIQSALLAIAKFESANPPAAGGAGGPAAGAGGPAAGAGGPAAGGPAAGGPADGAGIGAGLNANTTKYQTIINNNNTSINNLERLKTQISGNTNLTNNQRRELINRITKRINARIPIDRVN